MAALLSFPVFQFEGGELQSLRRVGRPDLIRLVRRYGCHQVRTERADLLLGETFEGDRIGPLEIIFIGALVTADSVQAGIRVSLCRPGISRLVLVRLKALELFRTLKRIPGFFGPPDSSMTRTLLQTSFVPWSPK